MSEPNFAELEQNIRTADENCRVADRAVLADLEMCRSHLDLLSGNIIHRITAEDVRYIQHLKYALAQLEVGLTSVSECAQYIEHSTLQYSSVKNSLLTPAGVDALLRAVDGHITQAKGVDRATD